MGLLNKFRPQKKAADFKDELVEHLADLLNTKKTFGSYPKDLGLDSYIYLGSDRKIFLQISEDIKNCLATYEKRVKQVEIIPTPSESRFLVSFVIKCKIDNNPCSFRLSFQHQHNSYQLEVKE